MITKEEALRASKMSLARMRQEYPKMAMIMDYIKDHYPKDFERFANIKMFQALMFNAEYSNSQIEYMIDKIAILNGFEKWGKLS